LGIYTERVLPHLVDRTCGTGAIRPYRQRVCAGLRGEVVEIGFGTGHNVPFYPDAVTSVTAVEPSDLSWRLADGRLDASPVPVQRAGLDGQLLPFDDDGFDTALVTFSLCTIPDPGLALGELRRVLRPGGTLHFLEHGLDPDPKVQRWQRRFEPIQVRLAGGCHLTRDVLGMLAAAGFEVREAEHFYPPVTPRFAVSCTIGVAAAA
jgi:ubiquinone/menaquinone biosynthesis C-methylase UbiE